MARTVPLMRRASANTREVGAYFSRKKGLPRDLPGYIPGTTLSGRSE
jgi:hypothetical protein